ncbi:histidine phosphatase family protein [Chitinophaga sp. Mgbs1]|uniref:Histidine phosphatase family protein n=1 Tax=Chitinophaga solisilvae TaxID=1233460 RepID=A0A9Q5D5P5_9BACT|nr:histidine phosphatase family protein [Chitinophaga solisilvae]
MRTLLLLLCCGLFIACKPKPVVRQPVAVSEDTTFLTGTFFLVRHAEKNPGPDSTLTPEGLQRAGALYRCLKDSGLQKIYTTRYIRSIQTADSLRLRLHLDTCIYAADTTGESLIYEITRHGDWGKRILIVGHSNTLLPLLHSLKAKPAVKAIGETVFDRLFIVRKSSVGVVLEENCY